MNSLFVYLCYTYPRVRRNNITELKKIVGQNPQLFAGNLLSQVKSSLIGKTSVSHFNSLINNQVGITPDEFISKNYKKIFSFGDGASSEEVSFTTGQQGGLSDLLENFADEQLFTRIRFYTTETDKKVMFDPNSPDYEDEIYSRLKLFLKMYYAIMHLEASMFVKLKYKLTDIVSGRSWTEMYFEEVKMGEYRKNYEKHLIKMLNQMGHDASRTGKEVTVSFLPTPNGDDKYPYIIREKGNGFRKATQKINSILVHDMSM